MKLVLKLLLFVFLPLISFANPQLDGTFDFKSSGQGAFCEVQAHFLEYPGATIHFDKPGVASFVTQKFQVSAKPYALTMRLNDNYTVDLVLQDLTNQSVYAVSQVLLNQYQPAGAGVNLLQYRDSENNLIKVYCGRE